MTYPLSIAVSTCGSRIARLAHWSFDERVRYLVLWQEGSDSAPALPSNVEVMRLGSRGVARSRNAALERASTSWLWFMDDDVELPRSSLDAVLVLLEDSPRADILICSARTPEGRLLSKMHERRLRRADLMSVGTIQILCNLARVRASGALFPTALGAGSSYPACDEIVFLSRCLRGGLQIAGTPPDVSVIHPEEHSGADLSSQRALIARAIAFREVFGFPLCAPVSTLFFLKYRHQIGRRFPWLFCFWVPAEAELAPLHRAGAS